MLKAFRIIGASALFLLLGISAPADARQDKQEEKAKPAQQQQQAKPERQQQATAPRQQQQAKPERQQQATAPKQQQQQAKPERQQQATSPRQQQQATTPKQQQQAKPERQQQATAPRQQQQATAPRQQQQATAPRQQQQATTPRQQQGNRSAQQRSPAQVREQQVAWQGDRARSWQSEHRTWQQRGGYNGYRIPDDRFRSYYGQDHGFRFYSLPVMYVGGHRRFQYGGFWFGLVDPWPEYWSASWYDDDDVYVDYYGDGYYLFNRRYPNDRIAISFYLN
jgi:hypothetical protein